MAAQRPPWYSEPMKTENTADVGKHAFEIAGLGLAPFRFVGASENVITYPDGTQKAGGSCDYCGTGIRLECRIISADGKSAVVGCNCISKVGDSGLLKAYKTSPAFRAHQRALARERARVIMATFAATMADNAAALKAAPHPYGFTDRATGLPLTLADYYTYRNGGCGAAGRARLLKELKADLAKLTQPAAAI